MTPLKRSKLAVIGDIHGDSVRLPRALNSLLADSSLHLVFVGDYVNRGPNTKAVLDLLLKAVNKYSDRITLLRGNHDEALLNFLNDGNVADFAAHSGMSTIRSYLETVDSNAIEKFRSSFPAEHLNLLRNTQIAYENEDVLISHCGFDPHDIDSRTPDSMYRRGHPELFRYSGPWPRPLTVCGHYIQSQGGPYISPNLICIDTGCGTVNRAPLTAIILPERKLIQY
ncbi:metallophosphoesterase [Streptosporangium sp. NPDC049046]|uniref:metallophosphoesterase n=1 Tax=Streptosporangium sp. NPDC049046 TaxID=3155031 RepID=UPI00342A26AE